MYLFDVRHSFGCLTHTHAGTSANAPPMTSVTIRRLATPLTLHSLLTLNLPEPPTHREQEPPSCRVPCHACSSSVMVRLRAVPSTDALANPAPRPDRMVHKRVSTTSIIYNILSSSLLTDSNSRHVRCVSSPIHESLA